MDRRYVLLKVGYMSHIDKHNLYQNSSVHKNMEPKSPVVKFSVTHVNSGTFRFHHFGIENATISSDSKTLGLRTSGFADDS